MSVITIIKTCPDRGPVKNFQDYLQAAFYIQIQAKIDPTVKYTIEEHPAFFNGENYFALTKVLNVPYEDQSQMELNTLYPASGKFITTELFRDFCSEYWGITLDINGTTQICKHENSIYQLRGIIQIEEPLPEYQALAINEATEKACIRLTNEQQAHASINMFAERQRKFLVAQAELEPKVKEPEMLEGSIMQPGCN